MTSSVDSHTIPPFYACYLMRSYATNSSIRTYIGSTPDPIRRKKQHNGILTQGAHKTKKGRPWETQMIIWGFPSKIAALQFEWAWQKPHLSRHLRTNKLDNKESEAGPSSTVNNAHIPLPLFTDTPRNQVAVLADGTAGLSTHSVQSCILVARALLKSEPFSTWGLRITFFEEYCWAGWIRLEEDLKEQITAGADSSEHTIVGLHPRKSRLGRNLPANHLSPAPACKFSGVDGSKNSLLSLSDEEKKALKLDDKKRKQARKGRSPGQWPEKLPQMLSAKAMGVTWKMIKEAPQIRKSAIEARNTFSEDDGEAKRVKWNDEDLADLSWQRFLHYLKKERVEISDLRGEKTTRQCYLCRSDAIMQDHLTYTTCPSPYLQLQPRPQLLDASEITPTLSQFGFDNGDKGASLSLNDNEADEHCDNIFHIACLARHFSRQSQEHTARFVLPTHGSCPSCHVEGHDEHTNTWVNIIRSVYRRKERLESEYLKADVAKAREEKLSLKSNAKKRTAPTKSNHDNSLVQGNAAFSTANGLLDALDKLQSKGANKRVSKQVISSLLKDPIHSSTLTTSAKPITTATTRDSLLCSLDNLINTPSQENNQGRLETKKSRSVFPNEVIDLT